MSASAAKAAQLAEAKVKTLTASVHQFSTSHDLVSVAVAAAIMAANFIF